MVGSNARAGCLILALLLCAPAQAQGPTEWHGKVYIGTDDTAGSGNNECWNYEVSSGLVYLDRDCNNLKDGTDIYPGSGGGDTPVGAAGEIQLSDGASGHDSDSGFLYGSNTLTVEGAIDSTAGATSTGLTFDATTARTTGDLVHFDNAGTPTWRISDDGGWISNSNRLLIGANLDEDDRDDTWGRFMLDYSLDGASTGTWPLARLRLIAAPNTTTSLAGKGLFFVGEWNPTAAGATSTSMNAVEFELLLQDPASAACTAGSHCTLNTAIATYSKLQFVGGASNGYLDTTNGYGFRQFVSFTGANQAIGATQAFDISVSSTKGTGTTTGSLYGLRIRDLKGFGTNRSHPVQIEDQTDVTSNTFRFVSGEHDNGGLEFDNTNMFKDSVTDELWVKVGHPTGDGDGYAIVICDDNPAHGVMLVGDGGTASLDTGDEICEDRGCKCDEISGGNGTFDAFIGGASAQDCVTTWATPFEAFCY